MAAPDLLPIFIVEGGELLAELDEHLLTLEEVPDDEEAVNLVFRVMHTFKGSSAAAELYRITDAAHTMEDALCEVRAGKRSATREMITDLLKGTDLLRAMLERVATGDTTLADVPGYDDVLARFAAKTEAPPAGPPQSGFEVEMRFQESMDAVAVQPEALIEELADLGELLSVDADISAVPPLADLDPYVMHVTWKVTLATTERAPAVNNVLMFVFVDNDISVRGLDRIPPKQRRPARVPANGEESKRRAIAPTPDATIRVDTSKLDQLLNDVGEVAIAVAQALAQLPRGETADTLERVNHGLQDSVMTLRLVPLRATLSPLKRVVRDLANSLGKDIDLVIVGAETELDKQLVEKLSGPLGHLVRNSVDHGLETPSARVAAGKPACGTVWIKALQRGGNVVIEVSDNGQGIDRDRVMAKALDRGLIDENATLSDAQVYDFLFHPGFSTAAKTTDVSGRGVGLDAVRRDVAGLGGRVDVSTQPGEGTTFSLVLPMTLAIVDGMAVRVGDQNMLIPMKSIVEQVRLDPERLTPAQGGLGELMEFRGALLPVTRLRQLLLVDDQGGSESESEPIAVVLEGHSGCFAAIVDGVVGEQQIVVKSLRKNFLDIRGFSGATILGDGRVSLILDPVALQELSVESLAH